MRLVAALGHKSMEQSIGSDRAVPNAAQCTVHGNCANAALHQHLPVSVALNSHLGNRPHRSQYSSDPRRSNPQVGVGK